MSQHRLHYMDQMRAFLMVFGIVLHAAQLYNPTQEWLYHDNSSSATLAWIVAITHSFRMPAFFIVAGFFCGFVLQRYSLPQFLERRFTRLLIPFVATAVSLNLLQSWLLNPEQNWATWLLSGEFVGHLWFLVNLMVYSVVVSVIALLMPSTVSSAAKRALQRVASIPVVVWLLLLPVLTLAIYASNKVGFPLYSSVGGVLNTQFLLLYLPYFLIGMVLFWCPALLSRWCRFSPLVSVPVWLMAWWLAQANIGQASMQQIILYTYANALLSWSGALLCFWVFHTFMNHASRTGRRISEASYSIYLFHHVLVILLGTGFARLSLPPLVEFGSIVVVTFWLTLQLHERVIARVPLFSWLFNGVRKVNRV